MIKPINKISVFVLFLSVQACTLGPAPKPDDPAYAPVLAQPQRSMASSSGSIYQPYYGASLFTDQRARQVGDIVTITLNETTSSTKSATTTLSKKRDITFGAPNILGTAPALKNLDLTANVSNDSDFEGDGSSKQSNQLSGSIAVTITEILPNGLLMVKGEKWITLNQGDEFIRIRGLIRPSDIDSSNRIASTKLADARITYSGKGEVSESNQMGWLSKFLNSRYWPF